MAHSLSPASPGDCTFCRVVRGETPSFVVLEDDFSLAFLDNRPLFPGHCLLVPRRHYAELSDLPQSLLGPLLQNAQLLAAAIETGLRADGAFVAINNKVSQSVPHLHVHVVPRRKGDGLRGFFWPRRQYSGEDEALATQRAISTALTRISGRTRFGDVQGTLLEG